MTSTALYTPVASEHFTSSVNKPNCAQAGAQNAMQPGSYTTTYTTTETVDPNTYDPNRRSLFSVVLSEEILGEMPPEHTVRYVEIPVVEEVVKPVQVKSVIEVEKIVPKYEVEYVERVVEVPQVHYIDRQVEKEHIEEVIREIPTGGQRDAYDLPRTVIKAVPKIEYVNVEKTVEVPGEVVDITKHHDFHPPPKPVKRHHDAPVPVIVAQTIRPVITESNEVIDVDVYEYEPQITPVDVYVATPIASKLTTIGAVQDVHQYASIPTAQYNTILKSLNSHIDESVAELPYVKENGVVEFLSPGETPGYVPAPSLEPTQLKTSGAQVSVRRSQIGVSRSTEDGKKRHENRASIGHMEAHSRQVTKASHKTSYQQPLTSARHEYYNAQEQYQGPSSHSRMSEAAKETAREEMASSVATPISRSRQIPAQIKKKKACEC